VKNQGANYSADVSAKIVKNLDEYFDFPYPLSKMDSVAVPVFSAGNLENAVEIRISKFPKW
jgi:aminopeptidase N